MSTISALFFKNNRQLINMNRVIKAQSRFKLLFVFFFAILFEIGIFTLFVDGFRLLSRLSVTGLMIMPRLFSFFFLGMGLMLVFSGIVSSYTTIFRSDEIPFLIVRPFTMSQIIIYRFLASSVFSSWAFLFIMIPFVSAFAWSQNLSYLFVVWTAFFSIPFLFLCSAIGTIITILFVRWLPRGKFLKYIITILLAALPVWLFLTGKRVSLPTIQSNLNLSSLVPGIALSSNRLIPSWWLSEGIMSLSRNNWSRGAMLWLLLTSNAALLGLTIELLGSHFFFDGWQRTATGGSKAATGAIPAKIVEKIIFPLSSDFKAMIIKDFKTFCRDPVQWSQALIFFGLLGLYFSNLRTFNYHTYARQWQNLISFLNVFSVSAVMCSLGSRFVYPQLSLEGHGFWILGLSPVSSNRIVMAKFLSSSMGMTVLSVGLMLLSSAMLNASIEARIVSTIIAFCVALAICSLSTGLGALFLNQEEKNPAAIVSGFGGTLNLIFCLCFMLAAILPFAFVFRLRFAHGLSSYTQIKAMAAASIWLLLITILTTSLPLYLGCRSMAKREF